MPCSHILKLLVPLYCTASTEEWCSVYWEPDTYQPGSVPPALALAEQLDVSNIAKLNHPPAYCNKNDIAYQGAWVSLESALALEDQFLLDRASRSFRTIHAANRNEKYRQDAGTVIDFLPLYRLRVRREPYPSESIRAVGKMLGRRALQDVSVVNDQNLGSFYQDIALALCANNGNPNYLMFPGSVREESGSTQQAGFNHDAYIIRDQKIPIQIKGRPDRPKYDRRVYSLNARSILVGAAVEIYGAKRWQAERHGRVFLPADKRTLLYMLTSELVIADASGKKLGRNDAAYLESIMQETRRRIDNFYEPDARPEPTHEVSQVDTQPDLSGA